MNERVTVLSETKQEFMGVIYYKCGMYFQKKGKRLHRKVWEHYNGEIPKGFHVHHVDGNRSNNQIENLELLDSNEHLSRHCNEKKRIEYAKMHMKQDMIPKAIEWHKSEEGRQWHSEHSKEIMKNRELRTYVCTMCGKEFETKFRYRKNQNHFCSPVCKARHLRKRRREERELK